MSSQLEYLYQKYGIKHSEDLEAKLIELSSIYEMNQRFLKVNSLEEIADLMLLVPMGRLLISKVFLFIQMDDTSRIFKKGRWFIPENLLAYLSDLPFRGPILQSDFEEITEPIHIESLQKNNVHLIFPIYHQSQKIGFMLFGAKVNKEPFHDTDLKMLHSMVNLNTPFLLNAISNEQLETKNIELDNHIQILQTILETSRRLDTLFNQEDVWHHFILTLMGRLTITKYAYIKKTETDFTVIHQKGFQLSEKLVKTLGEWIQKKSIGQSKCLDSLFIEELNLKGESYLFPYFQDNQLQSFLILGPKLNRETWKPFELEFSSILFSQVIHIMENIELVQEKIEKEILDKELEVAQSIQQLLLPQTSPSFDDLEVNFFNKSAKQVGGDYLDVIEQSDCIYFVVADVSGKSIPASLLMSNAQSALRMLVEFEVDLVEMMYKLNNHLCENTAADKFITLFIGKYNKSDNTFEYVDAGHNPPLLCHSESDHIEELNIGGILLGMMKDMTFQKGIITLQPNDLVFIYSDGVTETLSTKGEEWGESRLKHFLKQHKNLSPTGISDRLLVELKEFSSAPLATDDDITYIIIKKK